MKLIQDVNDEDRWKLYTIYTGLWELNGYSEKDVTGLNRPYHATPEDLPSSMNWQDYTDQKEQCLDEEPAVLIVGTYKTLHTRSACCIKWVILQYFSI